MILEVAASIYILRVENTACPKKAVRVFVGTSNVWLSNELDMSAASKKQYMTLERDLLHTGHVTEAPRRAFPCSGQVTH
jgi:hypothetical protein